METQTKTVAFTFSDSPQCVYAVAPDGETALMGDLHAAPQVRETQTGHCRWTLSEHSDGISSGAFSADGRLLAAAGTLRVTVWNTTTRENLKEIVFSGGAADAVCFSPDGQRLAVGDTVKPFHIHIYDVETGQEILSLVDHDQPVRRVVFAPDGLSLISASWWDSGAGVLRRWSFGPES